MADSGTFISPVGLGAEHLGRSVPIGRDVCHAHGTLTAGKGLRPNPRPSFSGSFITWVPAICPKPGAWNIYTPEYMFLLIPHVSYPNVHYRMGGPNTQIKLKTMICCWGTCKCCGGRRGGLGEGAGRGIGRRSPRNAREPKAMTMVTSEGSDIPLPPRRSRQTAWGPNRYETDGASYEASKALTRVCTHDTLFSSAAIDCVVSSWGSWGDCSKWCGGGSRDRTRHVLVPPQSGGLSCPATIGSEACNPQRCCM